jgi:putative flavoprotein involved in K+ transport
MTPGRHGLDSSRVDADEEHLDVAVVGGGQAGLALGYHLTRRGRRYAIFDAASEIGHSWRSRWESLTLFTPAQFSSLPGLRFPAPDDHYPSKDEVARYLQLYATTFELPVRSATAVLALSRTAAGFVLETNAGLVSAGRVVVATGPFQQPAVPSFARDLPTGVLQVHSAHYVRPEQLPPGDVLVVGGGNSGFQIASELAATRSVHLSVGRRLIHLPQRLLTRDLFWWLTRLGVMSVDGASVLGRFFRTQTDAVVGTPSRRLSERGVEIVPRALGVRGDAVVFADGRTKSFPVVVWATGYRAEYRWLRVPVLDQAQRPRHRAGFTPVPGLFFLGLPWQRTAGSALLGFVGRDARSIAERLT